MPLVTRGRPEDTGLESETGGPRSRVRTEDETVAALLSEILIQLKINNAYMAELTDGARVALEED